MGLFGVDVYRDAIGGERAAELAPFAALRFKLPDSEAAGVERLANST
jgi:hypothetical protein